MTYEKITQDIKAIVLTRLGISLDSSELSISDSLIGGRFNIGSMTAIDILSAIEQRYGMQFPDEAITTDLFSSIESLSHSVESLLSVTDMPSQMHEGFLQTSDLSIKPT